MQISGRMLIGIVVAVIALLGGATVLGILTIEPGPNAEQANKVVNALPKVIATAGPEIKDLVEEAVKAELTRIAEETTTTAEQAIVVPISPVTPISETLVITNNVIVSNTLAISNVTISETLELVTEAITAADTITQVAESNWVDTGHQPWGAFQVLWRHTGQGEGPMHYPLEAKPRFECVYARQNFEGGVMFWVEPKCFIDGAGKIYVAVYEDDDHTRGSTWATFPDTWEDKGDPYSCDEARANADTGGPIRGFGRVWCEHPEAWESLGKPLGPEVGGEAYPRAITLQFQGERLNAIVHDPIPVAKLNWGFHDDGWVAEVHTD